MTEKKLTINELRAGTKSSRALRIGGAAVLIAAVAAGVWYFGFADTAKVPVYRTIEITRGPLEVTVVANGPSTRCVRFQSAPNFRASFVKSMLTSTALSRLATC